MSDMPQIFKGTDPTQWESVSKSGHPCKQWGPFIKVSLYDPWKEGATWAQAYVGTILGIHVERRVNRMNYTGWKDHHYGFGITFRRFTTPTAPRWTFYLPTGIVRWGRTGQQMSTDGRKA